MTIPTHRLTLRPLAMDDAPRLAALGDDFEVARMKVAMPHPFTRGDAEALVRRGQGADPSREAWFAIDAADEGLVGAIGFDPDGVLGGSKVGYWIGRPYWGRGYATEAVRAALGWARSSWNRRFVSARHFADNPASAAVLGKAGFLHTGRVEQLHSLARGQAVSCRWMVWMA